MLNVHCCGIVCWTLRRDGGMLALEALAWHAVRCTFDNSLLVDGMGGKLKDSAAFLSFLIIYGPKSFSDVISRGMHRVKDAVVATNIDNGSIL